MKLSLSASLGLSTVAFILASGCVHGPAQQHSSPQNAGFYSQKLAAIDEAVVSAISSNKLPGGVLWIEHNNRSYHRAYGKRSVDPIEPIREHHAGVIRHRRELDAQAAEIVAQRAAVARRADRVDAMNERRRLRHRLRAGVRVVTEHAAVRA